MNETLQDLMERRLRELGHRRGRGESISLREAHERLVETINDRNREHAEAGEEPEPAPPTYEVFRRIRAAGHSKISAATARALATMLDVPLADVHAAIGQRPPLGPFELPDRAHQLLPDERRVVLGVIDAILNASTSTEQRPAAQRGGRRGLSAVPEAARDTGRLTERQRREAAERDPNVDPPGPEHGA